jgi:hypothetical protein
MIWVKNDWCKAVFLPLPKKGNIKECCNHRTISLICHASKIIINWRNKIKTKEDVYSHHSYSTYMQRQSCEKL